jgi:hypothetical protein
MMIVERFHIELLRPFLEHRQISNLETGAISHDKTIRNVARFAASELLDMMSQVREKLDFDLRQEITPAPFEDYIEALTYITELDAARDRLAVIPEAER